MTRACSGCLKSLAGAESAAEVPLPLTGMFAGRLTSVRATELSKDRRETRWLIDMRHCPSMPMRGLPRTPC